MKAYPHGAGPRIGKTGSALIDGIEHMGLSDCDGYAPSVSTVVFMVSSREQSNSAPESSRRKGRDWSTLRTLYLQ